MELIYDKQKYLKPPTNPPCLGHFAIDTGDSLLWDKCREEFLKRLPIHQVSDFYFCHSTYSADCVASFLIKTELILGLTSHSKFSKTDDSGIMWIEPDKFWMECQMKRQILTIFIRHGINYSTSLDNYEEALWIPDAMKKTYAFQTKDAIMRFLFGFTKYTASQDNFRHASGGWWSVFVKKDIQSIRELLVSPHKNGLNLVGAGELWG